MEHNSLLDKSMTPENQSVTVVSQNSIYVPILIEIGEFGFSLAPCLLILSIRIHFSPEEMTYCSPFHAEGIQHRPHIFC